MARDWVAWHDGYAKEGHPLRDRLVAVSEVMATALTRAPPGQVRLASLCAGDGRDVVGAVADHPRRADVVARLVEVDNGLAATARRSLAEAGIAGEVVTGDAGDTAVLAAVAPVDVLLLCGIFGNVSDADVERTIAAVPTLCRSGATVLWTRHRREPDLTPTIRCWFDEAGCRRLDLRTGGSAGTVADWAVGVERVERGVDFQAARLFRFVR